MFLPKFSKVQSNVFTEESVKQQQTYNFKHRMLFKTPHSISTQHSSSTFSDSVTSSIDLFKCLTLYSLNTHTHLHFSYFKCLTDLSAVFGNFLNFH